MMNYNNDPLLDPFFGFLTSDVGSEGKETHSLSMKTDIKEDDKNYIMDIDLPGIEKKDISVSLENGYLTIKAQANRDSSEKDKKGNYIHRERFSGMASRSYYVGDIDEKFVQATFNNGVLSLTLPKEEEKKIALQHKIAIK